MRNTGPIHNHYELSIICFIKKSKSISNKNYSWLYAMCITKNYSFHYYFLQHSNLQPDRVPLAVLRRIGSGIAFCLQVQRKNFRCTYRRRRKNFSSAGCRPSRNFSRQPQRRVKKLPFSCAFQDFPQHACLRMAGTQNDAPPKNVSDMPPGIFRRHGCAAFNKVCAARFPHINILEFFKIAAQYTHLIQSFQSFCLKYKSCFIQY